MKNKLYVHVIISSMLFLGGVGCCGVLLAVLVGAVALVVGFYVYCQQYSDDEICRRAAFQVKKYQYYANKCYEKYFPREW